MKKFTDLKKGDLLNAKQVLEIISWIDLETLYDWAAKSDLEPENYPPATKIGRSWVWPKRELVEFVNRKFKRYMTAS